MIKYDIDSVGSVSDDLAIHILPTLELLIVAKGTGHVIWMDKSLVAPLHEQLKAYVGAESDAQEIFPTGRNLMRYSGVCLGFPHKEPSVFTTNLPETSTQVLVSDWECVFALEVEDTCTLEGAEPRYVAGIMLDVDGALDLIDTFVEVYGLPA